MGSKVRGQLADVTFSVELTRREIEAVRLVIRGASNEQIAEELGVPIHLLEKNFRELHLDGELNLIDATRAGLVTWDFHQMGDGKPL